MDGGADREGHVPEQPANRPVLNYQHLDQRPVQPGIPLTRDARMGKPRSTCESMGGAGAMLLRLNRRLRTGAWILASLLAVYSGVLYLSHSPGLLFSHDAVVVLGPNTESGCALFAAVALAALALSGMGLQGMALSRARARPDSNCAVAVIREPTPVVGRILDVATVTADREHRCVTISGIVRRYCIYARDITHCQTGVGSVTVQFDTAEGCVRLYFEDFTPYDAVYDAPIPRDAVRLCVGAWGSASRSGMAEQQDVLGDEG